MRTRKIPLRKCVVCQEMKPKKELIRIVKTPESEIVIDSTGKKSGRGAYVCTTKACIEAVQKNRALERALKHSISKVVYEQLERYADE